jgi:predicted outer membrane repeat protein
MKLRIMTAALGLIFLLCGNAYGKTVRVPEDYSLIQSAIASAQNGDTVLVNDGTYTGPGNTNLDLMGKAISVKSENGPEKCIIDGQGSSKGFYFRNNEGAQTVVSGFTIRNGYAPLGGGIYCVGASPTISNCKITQNTAGFGGGGIACDASSSPAITGCEITENRSDFGGGGGIFIRESIPVITACAITGNRGDQGGGIHCLKSSPVINGCQIQNNTGDLGGGGIFCETDSSPSVINSLITENKAGFGGGGIYCKNSSSPTLLHCTIGNNRAELWNGVRWGGGILCEGASSPTMTNSIVWANTPNQWIMLDSSTPLVTYSDVQGGFSGAGNIDADPLFAEGTDYGLKAPSPCIDKGSSPSAGLPGNEHAALDYMGTSRPQGDGWDMGAIESAGAALPSGCPDCSGDNVVLEAVTFPADTTCQCVCTESITIGNGIKVESGANVTIRAPVVRIRAAFLAEEGSIVSISRE